MDFESYFDYHQKFGARKLQTNVTNVTQSTPKIIPTYKKFTRQAEKKVTKKKKKKRVE